MNKSLQFFLFLIFLVQVINVPFFGDQHIAGKWFFFSFLVVSILIFKNYLVVCKKFIIYFFILLVFSFLTSFYSSNSFSSYLAFSLFFICFSVTVLSSHISSTETEFSSMFLRFLFTVGVVFSCLGLYQYIYIMTLGPTASQLIPLLLPPVNSFRVVGPYGQPNLFALFLVVSLVAGFYVYLKDIFLNSRPLSYFKYLPIILISVVFFLTGSKAGIISFIVCFGLLFLTLVSGRYPGLTDSKRRIFISLFLSLVVGFIIYKLIPYVVTSDAAILREWTTEGISNDARLIFWTVAVLIFRDYSLFGVGFDNYKFYLAEYQPIAHEVLGFVQFEAMGYTNWAHNEYLQILAEGGIFIFILVIIALVYFFRGAYYSYLNLKNSESTLFFYYILALPFLLQSMLSWPLRYPPLLILFCCIIGVILSNYKMKKITFSKLSLTFYRTTCFFTLIIILVFSSYEIKIGNFAKKLDNSDDIASTFNDFIELSNHFYSKYRILKGVVPTYTVLALREDDPHWARKLLPYAYEISQMQGAYWQWHNLALLLHKSGNNEEALNAARLATYYQPTYEPSWTLLHYLNILRASEATGEPVESFYRNQTIPIDILLPEKPEVGDAPK